MGGHRFRYVIYLGPHARVQRLKSHSETFREGDYYQEGRKIHLKTYERVNNPEVKGLLSIGFPEFRDSNTAIVLGYDIAGANEIDLFKEYETELIVATAIHAEGASRQARSHVKASIALGNSVEAVNEVAKLADEFAAWTGNPLPHTIDIDSLALELVSHK